MEQSSLLRVLRDLTNENKELFKEHSNTLPSSRASSQVALRLSINGDVTSRSFPLDSERRSLTHIEEQVSIIFYPYLSKSKPVKKIRMFYIDHKDAEHALDTDETLQSIFDAQQTSTEEPLLSLRLELVDDETNDKQNYLAETGEELVEIECSICGELGTREMFFKCLHCNFTHLCCSCQITTTDHENHFTVPFSVLSKYTNGKDNMNICKYESPLDCTTYI